MLASITRFVESALPGTLASVSVLAADRQAFAHMVAPRLPDTLRIALERVSIAQHATARAPPPCTSIGRCCRPTWPPTRSGPSSARRRSRAQLRAAWSTPIKAAGGKLLGALGVYRAEAGLPATGESQIMARAAQLAGIAIERHLAEEALRSSEAKFRGLFESIAEGVYQSGRDGRLLSVNPAFVAMLGYAQRRGAVRAALGRGALLESGRPFRVHAPRGERRAEIRDAEFLMRTRDGQQLVILENARPMRDASGRITGYEGTIADITERKRAEQAIFAEKERAQVTLQSIGDAVISTDAEGCIEYINPVAETLTAWRLARGARPADRRGAEAGQRAHPRADRDLAHRRARARSEHGAPGRPRGAHHARRQRGGHPGIRRPDLRPRRAR